MGRAAFHSLIGCLRCFAADTRGATAIEYVMIAAGVGAAVAATVWGIGDNIKTAFYDKIAEGFASNQ